ncbi:MAG TPA: hypothetical protein PKC84_11640 [Paracoccaceae bacterium]|nr:hypothetical protein [Paracoccaceae bacterium]
MQQRHRVAAARHRNADVAIRSRRQAIGGFQEEIGILALIQRPPGR